MCVIIYKTTRHIISKCFSTIFHIKDCILFSFIYISGLFWLFLACNTSTTTSAQNVSLTKWVVSNDPPLWVFMIFCFGNMLSAVCGCYKYLDNPQPASSYKYPYEDGTCCTIILLYEIFIGSMLIILSIMYMSRIIVAITTMIYSILWIKYSHAL